MEEQVQSACTMLLLAKMFLNAEVYTGTVQGALTASLIVNKVIDDGSFSLDDQLCSCISWQTTIHSPEIIFPVCFDGQFTQTWGGATFLICAAIGSSNGCQLIMVVSGGWNGSESNSYICQCIF